MSNKRRSIWFWVSAWWPVAVGIALIATESTAAFGADRTSGPLRRIFEAIFGPVNPAAWDEIHHIIRKSGHFIGYGGLGLTWLRAWWMSLPQLRSYSQVLLAMLGTAVVASCDEWHQSFLPNRTASPLDVLLDCCGAAVMIAFVFLWLRLSRARRLVRVG
jgi:VanZ family protein